MLLMRDRVPNSEAGAVRPAGSGVVAGWWGPGSMALVLYGLIAAGLALAISVKAQLSTAVIVAAALAELVLFFVAHAYADVLGERYEHPEVQLTERVDHAVRHDVVLLLGGLPVIVIFGAARAAGVGASVGADLALGLPVLLFGAFGYLSARRGRVSRRSAFVEGLAVAVLAAAVLMLKLLLH